MHTDPRRRPAALRAFVTGADGERELRAAATPLPPEVTRWLAGLSLLQDVPFDALVPDARMLPPESIRFFFLDRNWTDALVDGALSVVDHSTRDSATLRALRGPAHAAVRATAATLRRERHAARPAVRRRAATTESAAPAEQSTVDETTVTGFLLRSALVTDWPGLTVRAWSDTAGTVALPLLRLDRPSPAVLVALFGGLAQQVRIAKPAQGLHFGAVADDGSYGVYLRGLGGRYPAGVELSGDPVTVPLRPDPLGRATVRVAELHDALAAALATRYAPDPAPALSPGGVGLQLTLGAEEQVFTPNGTTSTAPGTVDELMRLWSK